MSQDSTGQAGTLPLMVIEVTPAMIQAGLDQLREHHIGDDLAYVLETVFRAMAYESPSISFTIPAK